MQDGASPQRRVYIKTYGCQMNVYDSVRMADILGPLGYQETDNPALAHLIILNTCHIREKAAEKVYSELGRLRPLKEAAQAQGRECFVAVAGCVAQAEGEEMLRRAPSIDFVIGPQSYQDLPALLAKKRSHGQSNVVALEFRPEDKFDRLPEESRAEGASAFLSVQEGCDKFCTFCVVPYTRGAEYSRPAAAVLREAELMVARGVCEITLLGQNVNAYHGAAEGGEDWSLARLIRELAAIKGLERLRYTTSHPRDMQEDLIALHGEEKKLMPYLHLPVQSGSDRILKAMNRRHRAEEYIRIIERLRNARPDIALSSDFIVGFPGETEQDFEDTMALVREVGYAQAYSFAYSPRPGTPAASADDAVPEEVKSDRLQRLQALLRSQQEEFNRACVGREMPVLLEREGRHPGQLVGRSPYLQAVHVDSATPFKNQIVSVRITAVHPTSLHGEIVSSSSQPSASEPPSHHVQAFA